MIRVSVANLKKYYNEGKLISKWLELPASHDQINNALKEIGIDGEIYKEYFISDYIFTGKIKFNIKEYSSVMMLNDIAKSLQSLSEVELYAVQAYIELYGSDIDYVTDAIEFVKNGNFHVLYDCESMEDIAHYYINEAGIYDLPEIAKTYFDYEAFARDLEIEGTFVFLDGGICVELLN